MQQPAWVGNYSYFRARTSPDKQAVYDLDNQTGYSYRELDRRADVLANYLTKKLKVVKGDRIAFLTRNRIELFDAYYATGKTGTILVPYNARLSVEELAQLVNSETPAVLFYEDIFAKAVAQLKTKTDVGHYVVLPDTREPLSDLCYEEIIASGDTTPCCCSGLSLDDTQLIIHTGGTTGLPKGGMISHGAMLFNAMNEIVTWGISHSDSAHVLLPLFHTGGWNLLTLPLLHAGGQLLINKQFDPAGALEIIDREKPTFVFGAATIFRMMIDQPGFASTDFSSVKWVMAGAAPTPINIMEQFWDKGVRFVLGYGMTEAGPNNLSVPAEFASWDEIRGKFASVGKPMYFTLAKIIDDDGNELGDDEVGELIWSGPQIFSGYWNNKAETEKTLQDGWIYTGDMAKRDKDGYYYIVGRKKNMFISGGENVFPPEIEKLLYDLPQIYEASVIGVPDEKWGEVGKAVIALRPGQALTKAEVLAFLSAKLARYKVPRYIQFVAELPKNSVGKIEGKRLAALYGNPED
ncbi:MAG: AMP-binding protein [Negativicutes bacterium]|nr:AMP-binding protein [Negativicutes bacterium]